MDTPAREHCASRLTTPPGQASGATPSRSVMRLASCCALLAVTGACIESNLTELPGGTPATIVSRCDDGVIAEVPRGVASSCDIAPAEFGLAKAWEATLSPQRWGVTAHVGRFADSDEDGELTAADDAGIWLVPTAAAGPDLPIALLDGVGRVIIDGVVVQGAYRQAAAVAPGASGGAPMELVLASYHVGESSKVSRLNSGGLAGSVSVGQSLVGGRSLTRHQRSGQAALVWNNALTLLETNRTVLKAPGSDSVGLAADLDGDGEIELVTAEAGAVLITRQAPLPSSRCMVGVATNGPEAMFALGNMDNDASAEIVVSFNGLLGVCDADGTLLSRHVTGSGDGMMVGLAELDGDALPEVVSAIMDAAGSDGISVNGLLSFEHDLTPKWSFMVDAPGRSTFTLVDLDLDGRHEVLVHAWDRLLILGPGGETVAEAVAPVSNYAVEAPVVADIDGDDLAEILVTGDSPTIVAFDNSAGGWLVSEASFPWSGFGRHPGERLLTGELPTVTWGWWLADSANVWHGLAGGSPALPDLGVSLDGACAAGEGTMRFTLGVWNGGNGDLLEPVWAEVFAGGLSTPIATVRVNSPLAPGEGVSQFLELPLDELEGGITARLTSSTALVECGDVPNEATWPHTP